MKQQTLKGSFSLFGKGLHTGLSLTVTFNPAPENTGYKIQRIDLEGQPVIDAVAENVVDTQRGTVLGKGDARVSTVEHGLSALYAIFAVLTSFSPILVRVLQWLHSPPFVSAGNVPHFMHSPFACS
jgi:UDP-3-O-acyl-N-acetylglucosamine deacetylase